MLATGKQILGKANKGNYEIFAKSVLKSMAYSDYVYSNGMHISVDCGEEIPFSNLEEMLLSSAENPEFGNPILNSTGPMFGICKSWDATPITPEERLPVHSDIPTLVLKSEYDPIIPSYPVDLITGTLNRSHYVEFPGVQHGILRTGECALQITLGFLISPEVEPNIKCISRSPDIEFFVPEATVGLVPYTNHSSGIEGLIPESWSYGGTGIYYIDSPLGQVILLQFTGLMRSSDALDDITNLLGTATGTEPIFEDAGDHEANGIKWSLYTSQNNGQAIDAAVARDGPTTYIVLLANDLGAYDFYRERVFWPVVEALHHQ